MVHDINYSSKTPYYQSSSKNSFIQKDLLEYSSNKGCTNLLKGAPPIKEMKPIYDK